MWRFIVVLLSSFCLATNGYMPVLLVGPYEKTFHLAKHYSDFYQIPLLEKKVYMFPSNFIMISEEKKQIENILMIDIDEYPHIEKNPNYFISWIKQHISV